MEQTTREAGWTLRNSRGQYILTLDELEAGSLDTAEPVIEVEGIFIVQLKKDTVSHLESQGPVNAKKVQVHIDRQGRRRAWNWNLPAAMLSAAAGTGESWMQTILLQSGWRAETLPLQAQSLAL